MEDLCEGKLSQWLASSEEADWSQKLVRMVVTAVALELEEDLD